MKISEELSSKLKVKKFIPKVKPLHERKEMTEEEQKILPSLNRELENGYKEIERLKRVI